jgi:hypothetical protein
MTLDEELKTLERKQTADNSDDEPMTLAFIENKSKEAIVPSKSAKHIKAQIMKK